MTSPSRARTADAGQALNTFATLVEQADELRDLIRDYLIDSPRLPTDDYGPWDLHISQLDAMLQGLGYMLRGVAQEMRAKGTGGLSASGMPPAA